MNPQPLNVIPGAIYQVLVEPLDNLPLAPNVFKQAPGAKVHLIKNPAAPAYKMADIDVLANSGPRSKTKSTYGFTAPASY
jgi:hypothetical protein